MRITDFELQTQSGQLWLDIQERLAPLAGLKAENETLKGTLAEHQAISDALVLRAQGILASGDFAAMDAILAEASVYPAARAAARRAAEVAELADRIAQLETQRLALLATDAPAG